MALSTALSRDIVTARFLFNAVKESGPSIGDYKWSANTTDFNGWLMCDGRELNIDHYADLYDIVCPLGPSGRPATYGTASTGKFRLPDCRSRTLVSSSTDLSGLGLTTDDNGRTLTTKSIGAMAGEEIHQLMKTEIPQHTHGFTADQTADTTGNTNNVSTVTEFGSVNVDASGGLHSISGTTDGGNVGGYLSTSAAYPHNNMQPYIVVGSVFLYSGVLGKPPTYDLLHDLPDETEYNV